MELLGYSLYEGADSLTPLPPKQLNGTNVKLENGAFDELAFSTNIVRFGQPIVNTWESDTILHAKFDNNLRGGNLAYRADTVSMVRVKRREQGESMGWVTIKEVPITKIEDFTFTYIDKYARARTNYEYAVVPVINNIEMEYTIGTVYSVFDGIIICDKENSFQTIADESIPSITKRNPSSTAETLDGKYPYVFFNGNTNYETGSVQGLFVEIDWDRKVFKTASSFKYRDRLMAFLTNHKPKILKCFDGRIWMIDVTSDPTATVQNHPDQILTSFNFTEIGDVNSTSDMYYNGLSELDREGS